ncbi:MAG: Nif3-like dinuclear metal center hexameric protein [Deltaproteobacteria bacterium]|nr:Nif3-like dinuclear metal center hexameric protein [Deltaproteobacteria bacterium]
MKVHQIVRTLETIAPLKFAEEWDNVGLLAGDPDDDIDRVLLTIDMTLPVVHEAIQHRSGLIIAYHPPIFNGLKRIDARAAVGVALRHGIAFYSPHTALDAAIGGTNDVLADAVGLTDRIPIKPFKEVAGTKSDFLGVGMGRVGHVAPTTAQELIARVKAQLGLSHVLVAGPTEGVVIKKVAVAAGAASDLLRLAIRVGADALVCGELRHHDALAAAAAGLTVIVTRHSCSERQALTPLMNRLKDLHKETLFMLSECDADPLTIVS